MKQAETFYLCVLAWGKPEFEAIDAKARLLFRRFVEAGVLIGHMKELVRQVVAAVPGIAIFEDHLPAVSQIHFGDDLFEIALDAAGSDLSQIMLAITKLSGNEQVQMHPTEGRAADFIRQNVGCSHSEVARHLCIAYGSFTKNYVPILKAHGFQYKRRAWFPPTE